MSDKRFKKIGSIADLDRAIKIANMAVDVTPLNNPGRTRPLDILRTWQGRQFKWTGIFGVIDDLNRVRRAAWLNFLMGLL